MNYIDLIRNFWRSHEVHSFSVTEIALYFHLIEVCNLCSWKNPFRRNNSLIMAHLGIKDRRTLDNARNKLAQTNLIKCDKKATNPNVTYTITSTFNAEADVQVDAQVNVQADVQVSAQADDTKDKLNKTKLIKNTPSIPQRGKKRDLFDCLVSFVNSKILPDYKEYLEMRKEIRKPFNSKKAIEANYKRLQDLSGHDIEIARKIIKQSIANQWQGLFPLKEDIKSDKMPAKLVESGDYMAKENEVVKKIEEETKKRYTPHPDFLDKIVKQVPG